MDLPRTILIMSTKNNTIRTFKVFPATLISIFTIFLGMVIFSCVAGYKLYQAHLLFSRIGVVQGAFASEGGVGRAPSRSTAKISIQHDEMLAEIDPEDLDTGNSLASTLNFQMHKLGEEMTIEQHVAKELIEEMRQQRMIILHTPSLKPAEGPITSSYGWRDSPFSEKIVLHKGIDIASMKSSPVYAPADGIVKSYQNAGSFGNVMVIRHGHGLETRYGHLNETAVRTGQHVKRGDVIAYLGDSGRATGSHLHYEIIINGVNVDPQRYVLK